MFATVSVKATTDACVQRSVLMSAAYCMTFKLVPFLTVKLTQRSAVMRRHVKLPCDDDDEDDCNDDAAEDDADDADQGVHEAQK